MLGFRLNQRPATRRCTNLYAPVKTYDLGLAFQATLACTCAETSSTRGHHAVPTRIFRGTLGK
jgi:hypothetical protein